MKGIEIIVDDFLVCGFGDAAEEALANHDVNLQNFLTRAQECGLTLNPDKVKLRYSSVPFIGHVLIDEGLAPDSDKTVAIMNMPTPTNVKSLQEFLWMVQYLAKFLPQLSKVTETLRKLECKKAQWCWDPAHDKAVSKLKQMICKAPVLKYFDPTTEVTLQCDALESYSLL